MKWFLLYVQTNLKYIERNILYVYFSFYVLDGVDDDGPICELEKRTYMK